MKLFLDDPNFDGQLQRSVGKADSGMANVGECLAIAAQITAGDRDSWCQAWSASGCDWSSRPIPHSTPDTRSVPAAPSFGPPNTSVKPSPSTEKTWTATNFG